MAAVPVPGLSLECDAAERFWRVLWERVVARCGEEYCVGGRMVKFDVVKRVVLRALRGGVDDEDAITVVVAEGLALPYEEASKLVNLVLADYTPEG